MNKEALTSLLNNFVDPLTNIPGSHLSFQSKIEGKEIFLRAGFPTKSLEQSLLSTLNEAKTGFTFVIDSFIKAHQTQFMGKGLRGIKNTIAVASGKGGVGKSTMATNLAIALAKAGASVGLLDADIYGPSIPQMLGKHKALNIVDDQYIPIEAHGIKAMSIGYLAQEDQALIWRGPMLAKTLLHLIDFTHWGELDYLILDLPPGTGDIQLSLVQKIPLAGAIVVTTPQTVATKDAHKAIQLFEKTGITTLGLVENMAAHQCSQCGQIEAIFGAGGSEALAKLTNLPFIGQIPLNEAIQRNCDEGNPTALGETPLAHLYLKIALEIAIALAERPLNYANKFDNIIVE